MPEYWSQPIGPTGEVGDVDYWDYWGARFAALAEVRHGARILDVGCGTGASLFPAALGAGPTGRATGIELCPH